MPYSNRRAAIRGPGYLHTRHNDARTSRVGIERLWAILVWEGAKVGLVDPIAARCANVGVRRPVTVARQPRLADRNARQSTPGCASHSLRNCKPVHLTSKS